MSTLNGCHNFLISSTCTNLRPQPRLPLISCLAIGGTRDHIHIQVPGTRILAGMWLRRLLEELGCEIIEDHLFECVCGQDVASTPAQAPGRGATLGLPSLDRSAVSDSSWAYARVTGVCAVWSDGGAPLALHPSRAEALRLLRHCTKVENSAARTPPLQARNPVPSQSVESRGGFMFFLFDWWGRWAIDRAGVESGFYSHCELRQMLDAGEITPRTWLRHVWTRRFSLVGEVLFANREATQSEFDGWFPTPTPR